MTELWDRCDNCCVQYQGLLCPECTKSETNKEVFDEVMEKAYQRTLSNDIKSEGGDSWY
jgi:hypothetical protein